MKIEEIFNKENIGKQYRFSNYEDKAIYTLGLYPCGKLHLVNENNETIDQVNHLQDIVTCEFEEVKK